MTMHSWVFRNRSRLRWIYGPTPEPSSELSEAELEALQEGRPTYAGATAGRVERDEDEVVLHPMPRRAG